MLEKIAKWCGIMVAIMFIALIIMLACYGGVDGFKGALIMIGFFVGIGTMLGLFVWVWIYHRKYIFILWGIMIWVGIVITVITNS